MLTTPDLKRALGFYRDLLGGEVYYQFPAEGEPMYVTLRCGSSSLGIGEDTETAGRNRDSGVFSLCVYVDDVDAALKRLGDAHAVILSQAVDQPWGERMAEIADPDGTRIVLMSKLDA